MKKIYSKVEDGKLLHLINYKEDIIDRTNICDAETFIQCASLRMKKGDTFKPHKHIIQRVIHEEYIPQESWVVIKGSVKCVFYDLDNTVIDEPILNVGDASFTFYGGHTYEILEDDTIVYEYKTGPYLCQENDKKFI